MVWGDDDRLVPLTIGMLLRQELQSAHLLRLRHAGHVVSQEWAEKVNRLLPDSQLAVIESAGHAVNLDDPDHLVPLIQSFVKDTAL